MTTPPDTDAMEVSEEDQRILPWNGAVFGERKNDELTVKLRVCPTGMAELETVMKSRLGPTWALTAVDVKNHAVNKTAKLHLPT